MHVIIQSKHFCLLDNNIAICVIFLWKMVSYIKDEMQAENHEVNILAQER